MMNGTPNLNNDTINRKKNYRIIERRIIDRLISLQFQKKKIGELNIFTNENSKIQ